MPKIEFWYDFASTYSYLTAIRITELAQRTGVEVEWRPFLLGPIFQAQGWSTSPFNLYPAKGRYMKRDIERIAAERGRVFLMPDTMPQHSVLAARMAIALRPEGRIAEFSRAVFEAEFEQAMDIGTVAALTSITNRLGLDSAGLFARIAEADIKQQLRVETEHAAAAGIFGAPTFRTADDELFWGDDRLEQSMAWAIRL
jgi:2-hydroxychromene-2-carboxylate isomerase